MSSELKFDQLLKAEVDKYKKPKKSMAVSKFDPETRNEFERRKNVSTKKSTKTSTD